MRKINAEKVADQMEAFDRSAQAAGGAILAGAGAATGAAVILPFIFVLLLL